jgi:peptidoglycan/xylan/chitin deacetylase (PgdA/CDA1 family)
MPWLLIVLLGGAVVFAHTAPFPFLLDWMQPGVSVWRMPPSDPPAVYLTFDDGPNPTATPMLLDVLSRERVPATFFVIDRHLTPATAPIVRRMFQEGHAVGLHSHTRRPMVMGPRAVAASVERAAERMEQLTGQRPCSAFRPHAGWRSWMMMRGLRQRGFRLIGWGWFLWDADPFRTRRPERLVPRLAARAGPGSIIVLHDGHHVDPAADRRYAVAVVEQLIPRLRARGFEFGTICDASGASPPRVRLQERK